MGHDHSYSPLPAPRDPSATPRRITTAAQDNLEAIPATSSKISSPNAAFAATTQRSEPTLHRLVNLSALG